MEENKSKKFSLSTFFLVLAIILIIIMGYFVYKLYNEKITSAEEFSNLNNQISDLENTVDNLQGKIDSISNTINDSTTNNDKYTEITDTLDGIDTLYVTNIVNNNNNTYTLEGVLYTQYTLSNTELQQIVNNGKMQINNEFYTVKASDTSNEYDLYESNAELPLYKVKPNDSGDYYLEAQAQISNVWKLTNEYRKITVSGDTKCSVEFDYEEKYNTVEDLFKDFKTTAPVETTNPNSEKTFTFKFENGKCVEVISVLTAV